MVLFGRPDMVRPLEDAEQAGDVDVEEEVKAKPKPFDPNSLKS